MGLDNACESSPWEMIHMHCEVLFSWKEEKDCRQNCRLLLKCLLILKKCVVYSKQNLFLCFKSSNGWCLKEDYNDRLIKLPYYHFCHTPQTGYLVSFILLRKRKLVALLNLSSWCLVSVSVLCLFLWSAELECDSGISWPYSLTFCHFDIYGKLYLL